VIVDSHLDLNEPSLFIPGSCLQRKEDQGSMLLITNNFSTALSGGLLTPGLDAEAIFNWGAGQGRSDGEKPLARRLSDMPGNGAGRVQLAVQEKGV
jgi:hypothetical protein